MTKRLPRWSPFNKEYIKNPYPFLQEIREKNPIHKNNIGYWIVTKYEDVKATLGNKAFHALSTPYLMLEKEHLLSDSTQNFRQVFDSTYRWLVFMEAPIHSEYRKITYRCWNKIKIEPFIDQLIKELIESVKHKESIDFMESLAVQIPIKAICKIVGLDDSGIPLLRKWSLNISKVVEPYNSLITLKKCNQTAQELTKFVKEQVERNKKLAAADQPSNFITAFLEATNGKYEEKELLSIIQLLFFAGIETTIHLFGNILFFLINNPQTWEQINQNPDKLDLAIEELIRYCLPLHNTLRIATEDQMIGDQLIKKGDKLFLSLAAANRDPKVFDRPEVMDIHRNPNPHLSFGYAQHYCLGSKLAKLEVKYFLKHLIQQGVSFEKLNKVKYDPSTVMFRVIEELPVKVLVSKLVFQE